MPPKGAPTGIHEEVESDEQWEQLLHKEGLIVVDVYPKWSGFCKALANNFKRLKLYSSESSVPLIFAAAQTDSIEALKKYRGRCEPCFLMFGGGVMVGVERGVNVPCLNQTIMERLEDENSIQVGMRERVEVTDPVIALLEEEERRLAEEAAEMDEIIETEVTFCIIKPDAVENGLAPDILARMTEDGITILRQEERQLTDEQARCIYGSYELQDIFEGLINYICSGNSILMAIARGDTGVIADFREMIGPNNVEEARQNNPDCYRALFGTTSYQNAIHSSDSIESACRELAFFFPDFTNPIRVKEKPKMENTLCIIRPEAVLEFVDDIKEQIVHLGFEIVIDKEIEMSEEQFDEFYHELDRESDYYEILKEQMTCGVAVVMMIRKLTGIEAFKEVLGSKELSMPPEEGEEEEGKEEEPPKPQPEPEKPLKKRKTETDSECGEDQEEEEEMEPFVPLREAFRIAGISINLIHGSENAEEAAREIAFFWPMEHSFMIVKPGCDEHTQGVEKTVIDAGLVIAARKTMQLCIEEVALIYERIVEEEFYPRVVEYMTSGMVQVYLIAGYNAVERLRVLQGPTDYAEAIEHAPNSLRARFGTDTLRNGIHASSRTERAKEMMDHFFGTDLDFDEEGRLDLRAALDRHHSRDDGDVTKTHTRPSGGGTIKEEETRDTIASEEKEEEESQPDDSEEKAEGDAGADAVSGPDAEEGTPAADEEPPAESAPLDGAPLAGEAAAEGAADGAPPADKEPPAEANADSGPPVSEEPTAEADADGAPPAGEEQPAESAADGAPAAVEEPPAESAPPASEEPPAEVAIDSNLPADEEQPAKAVADEEPQSKAAIGGAPASEEPPAEAVGAPPINEEPPAEAVGAPPISEEPPAEVAGAPPISEEPPAEAVSAPPISEEPPAEAASDPPISEEPPAEAAGAPPISEEPPTAAANDPPISEEPPTAAAGAPPISEEPAAAAAAASDPLISEEPAAAATASDPPAYEEPAAAAETDGAPADIVEPLAASTEKSPMEEEEEAEIKGHTPVNAPADDDEVGNAPFNEPFLE